MRKTRKDPAPSTFYVDPANQKIAEVLRGRHEMTRFINRCLAAYNSREITADAEILRLPITEVGS